MQCLYCLANGPILFQRYTMRPALFVAALCSAVCFCVSARAETVDFSISGVDDFSTPYTANFAIDPSKYIDDFHSFAYESVAVTTNGVTETLDLEFNPVEVIESVSFVGSNYLPLYNFFDNGVGLPLMGYAPSGLPPTVTPGTFTGHVECLASVRMPERMPGVLSTLALLQLPSLSIGCGDLATLVVGAPTTPPPPPPTVTPEPSTIALLSTGALGALGMVRRRFQR